MELYLFMWWLVIFAASFILLSALDELILDIAYLYHVISHHYRMWKYGYKPLTLDDINAVPEKKIAIMVACWNEHLVIENMLKHNIPAINYQNYDIFVGVYPNDELTIQAVTRAQFIFKNIIPVVTPHPGPSTKADNLNNIYHTILDIEKRTGVAYDIFIFHDAEDVIHPLSLKMYNFLIPRKDMVQIPVFPLEVSHAYATHWTYNDEFAENHTKTMIAREVIGGLVTSAGVGTAFSRKAISLLDEKTKGKPFNVKALTEDYHISLELRLLKLKSIFLTQRVLRTQTKKKWWLFGPLVPKNVYEFVATRALFPTRYLAAVRQRARWISGITLQEWQTSGWPGDLATRYTLFHDRKALVTHLINFIAYITFFYWLCHYIFNIKPGFFELLNQYPWVVYIIYACTTLMLIRLIQRVWATYQIYGFVAAFLSIPRAVYSNLINFHSLIRAYRTYFGAPKKDTRAWDKTKNTFPNQEALQKYNKKLGDLLLEKKVITTEQLVHALVLQKKTKQKLGEILIDEYKVAPAQVIAVLAKQYNMDVADAKAFPILKQNDLDLSEENYQWLIDNQFFPVSFYNNSLTLALSDPTNELKNKEAINRLNSYQIKFVLLSDALEQKNEEDV
ncbi:MAG: phage adsorption protein NrfB [Proteobacteria bacterium]|nr:phage adsorption protein NrfB [Pseudomonadota bacterium]